MNLKVNVVANFAGQGWRAVMSLAFIPVYIRLLGVEAYGLIGLFAALQLWLGLLDLGLRPVMAREAARFTGGAHHPQGFWAILRTAEVLVAGIAVLAGGAVSALSVWLSTHWVNPQELAPDAVRQAFVLMGVVAAIQMLESLYASVLGGLQRQVALNAVQSAAVTLRAVGAVLVLLAVEPTLEAFFLWQAFASAVSVLALGIVMYRSLPRALSRPAIGLAALRPFAGYAGGMIAIAVLSLGLTQSDKMILAGSLSLADFGSYALASSAAGVIGTIAAPIGMALYPKLTELHEKRDEAGLAKKFSEGTRMVTVLAGTGATMLFWFGERILLVWTDDAQLATGVARPLALLALGTALNAISAMPYLVQLAHGWTTITVKINIVALAVFVPVIFLASKAYGAMGAAVVWAVLNLVLLIASATMLFLRTLHIQRRPWFLYDVAAPLAMAMACGALLSLVLPPVEGRLTNAALMALCGAIVLGAAAGVARLLPIPELPWKRGRAG